LIIKQSKATICWFVFSLKVTLGKQDNL
jgi:hypothetical protein